VGGCLISARGVTSFAGASLPLRLTIGCEGQDGTLTPASGVTFATPPGVWALRLTMGREGQVYSLQGIGVSCPSGRHPYARFRA